MLTHQHHGHDHVRQTHTNERPHPAAVHLHLPFVQQGTVAAPANGRHRDKREHFEQIEKLNSLGLRRGGIEP